MESELNVRRAGSALEADVGADALTELDALYAKLKAAESAAVWGLSFERQAAAHHQLGELGRALWDRTLAILAARATARPNTAGQPRGDAASAGAARLGEDEA